MTKGMATHRSGKSIGCYLVLPALLLVANAARAASTNPLLYAPDPPDKPIQVAVALEVENIARVDEVSEQFAMDGDLLATWNDPRLAYKKANPDDPDQLYSMGSIWTPSIDIVNAVTPRERRNQSLAVAPDGTVRYTERFHADLSSRFGLRKFPFDTQSLEIHFSPFLTDVGRETLTVANRQSSIRIGAESYSSLAQWNIGAMSVRNIAIQHFERSQGVVFSIQVKRRYGFYIWKVFVPLVLMVFLSWAVFWIEPSDLSNQVQIAVTTILTVIAFAFAISATMPRVPYITLIDAFFLTCYVFAFLAVVELMTVHTAHRTGGWARSKRIRAISRWLVPSAYALTLLFLALDFLT